VPTLLRMCGICGVVSANGSADPERVARMSATLVHRGPDSFGEFWDGTAALAARRLSIIDLSGGRQPLATADGRLWVTFNGEIFNYVELRQELIARGREFRTKSDTETILHAYAEFGPQCVQSFNGDFAYAIWDRANQRLVIARDRMGVRLTGVPLEAPSAELLSCGIVAGAVQVPPGGTPIVLLADHQTTGGYPIIATVVLADLGVVAQAAPGEYLRFERVTPGGAGRSG